MRWSKTYIYTLKDISAKAEIPSYRLMIRAGCIKKVAPGIYTYQNLALKALQKIETIIREELDKKDCTEILMPMVHPRCLWEESKRWDDMGDALLKFKNRNDHEFCLSPTHEEVVTDLIRYDLKSYKDFPKNLYQIQTKFRDEIRPRFGLLRGREFIMKDAYSFDVNTEGALKSYAKMHEAYRAIFDRLGINYKIVQADSGSIGGSQSEEFHALADNGEDALMVCKCPSAYNLEIAPIKKPDENIQKTKNTTNEILPMEKFTTPHVKTIRNLSKLTGIDEEDLIKTKLYKGNKRDNQSFAFCVLVPGSHKVDEEKLKKALDLIHLEDLSEKEVFTLTGASPGSCGPIGLSCPIYMDKQLQDKHNYMVGANKTGFHLKNVNHLENRDFKVTDFIDVAENVQPLYFKIQGHPYQFVEVFLRKKHEIAPLKLKKHLNLETVPEEVPPDDPELQKAYAADLYYLYKDNDFTKKYSPTGEGAINLVLYSKDEKCADIRLAKEGDQCPKCSGKYKKLRGIELGHIFYLGTKYSRAMKATYLDHKGIEHPIEMGCYGIGVSRTLQTLIEQNHDKDGIIWPIVATPYHVHICPLDMDDQRVNDIINLLEEKLEASGITVFIDDRDERPGVKFKDADLLGFPFRITIGKRNLIDTDEIEDQQIELVERNNTSNIQKLKVIKAINYIDQEILPL